MFGSRLGQVHISEVNSRSTHEPLSEASMGAFEKISHLISVDVPVIVESPVDAGQVKEEMKHARVALSTSEPTRSASQEARSSAVLS
jgi:hypothetical protein